jgi:hypothetical protein
MPIKLTDPVHHPLDGLRVGKQTIKDMVTGYRTIHAGDPNKCLKFIHFNLQEVIQLFIDNGVLDSEVPLSDQLDQDGLAIYGLKIYLGNHVDATTIPPNDPGSTYSYLHKDTAILCNTVLTNRTWIDQLDDSADAGNSISILGTGDGLDRGSICPPSCPTTPASVDPDGYYQQDILP